LAVISSRFLESSSTFEQMLLSDIGWRDIQALDRTKPTKKQRLIRNAPLTMVIEAAIPDEGVNIARKTAALIKEALGLT
jgi:hypothetical protein